jgi:hypothetical protein
VAVQTIRNEQDVPQYWPKWWVQFAMRVGKLERGKVYEVMLVLPEGDAEPQWFVKSGSKLEGGR